MALARAPLPPSSVVHSGGGLHAYWHLVEPLDAVTERERAESLLRRLAAYFTSDVYVAEVARVLRVPGTLNYKAKYGEPRPVVLERLDAERAYNPSDFDEWLPADPGKPEAPAATGDDEPIRPGQRHGRLIKLLGAMRKHGAVEAEMLAAALAFNARCDPAEARGQIRAEVRSMLRYPGDDVPLGVEDGHPAVEAGRVADCVSHGAGNLPGRAGHARGDRRPVCVRWRRGQDRRLAEGRENGTPKTT